VTAPRGLDDGSDRRGMHIPLSPLMLTSMVAAGVGTVLLTAFLVIQFQSEPPSRGGFGPDRPGADPPPLPPPEHLAFIVAMAIFAIAWLAVLAAASRDQLMRRIGVMEARLTALTTEYGEHRRTEGFVEGMHEATRTDPPPSISGGRLRRIPPHE
jgi:hypothetical protein